MKIPENLILPFSGEQYVQDPVIIEKGDGAFLWDINGKKYLDGFSSLWVSILGHNHPQINEAIVKQLLKLSHATLYGQAHKPAIELTNKLLEFLDLPEYRVLYGLSGSDAVESAVKIVRQYWLRKETNPKRKRIVTFSNSYHGETSAAMSVSGFSSHDDQFPGLVFEKTEASSPVKTKIDAANNQSDLDKKSFRDIVAKYDNEIGAVIMEPVYGAGGILFPSKEFLSEIQMVCREKGYLLIVDEVATGFYRTGSKFCFQEFKISPDILILGKALSAGYLPLSATVISPEVGAPFERKNQNIPIMHGHTFSGNPLSCSAALANIDALDSGEFSTMLKRITGHFSRKVMSIIHEDVAEIRKKGLFAGIEIFNENKGRINWSDIALRVCNESKKEGVLIRPLGNVIVLAPPAVISEPDIDTLIEIVTKSIKTVCKE